VRRAGSFGLPSHGAGGYRNRRFAIIRGAALVSGGAPFPQIGIFLRCAGLAGKAFFTMVDNARAEIEPRLQVAIEPGAVIELGASRHPRMTDIAAILAASLPGMIVRPNSILHGCLGSALFAESFRVAGGRF
jgi:hypothetical protein